VGGALLRKRETVAMDTTVSEAEAIPDSCSALAAAADILFLTNLFNDMHHNFPARCHPRPVT